MQSGFGNLKQIVQLPIWFFIVSCANVGLGGAFEYHLPGMHFTIFLSVFARTTELLLLAAACIDVDALS